MVPMRVWTLMLKDRPVHRIVVYEGKPMVIGRTSEADVNLDNPSISRIHAVVELENGQDYLTDTDSTNGTWVNGKKITERTPITQNDEIKIGKFTLVAGSVGLLDEKKKGRPILTDDEKHTMFAPEKDRQPAKKESSSRLGRLIEKIFK